MLRQGFFTKFEFILNQCTFYICILIWRYTHVTIILHNLKSVIKVDYYLLH